MKYSFLAGLKNSVVQVGVERYHGHSEVVKAWEWDRGKINGRERQLPQKELVTEEQCREEAARGIVECIVWKGKWTAMARYESVCLV